MLVFLWSNIIMVKHTIEEVRKEFAKRGYELLETEYKNNSTPMRYICNKHRDEGVKKITYGNFSQGKGCATCGAERSWAKRKHPTINSVRQAFQDRGYELLSDEYISAQTKLYYRCPKHPDTTQSITWNNFQRGNGCRLCANEARGVKRRVGTDRINEKLQERNYKYVRSYYDNSRLYIVYICPKHEDYGEQTISWWNLSKGQGCRYCQDSKGEMIIARFLAQFNIEFESQKMFDDCRHIDRLKFDFWLPKHSCVIEYDGEQHFKPIQFGGISLKEANERFSDTKVRDEIKNQYCKHHDIDLIRIPYWERDNIEKILCEKLNIC